MRPPPRAMRAQLLLMDDGLQHLTLHRDVSLLCVDAVDRLGNGRVLPAGPLREPLERALAKADAVVAVQPAAAAAAAEDDELRTALALPPTMPVLRGSLEPEPQSAASLSGGASSRLAARRARIASLIRCDRLGATSYASR